MSMRCTNTTSVYTSARIFPMLPERLSTDLTSLNLAQDRLAMVTEMVFNADASLAGATVYRARVRNKAKLDYDAVSAWIDGDGRTASRGGRGAGHGGATSHAGRAGPATAGAPAPEGSLELETFQPRAVFDGEQVVDIRQQVQNRARQLIEEVMIATNGCTARYLAGRGGARCGGWCVRPNAGSALWPWPQEYGETLPTEPDSRALEDFWPSATRPTRCGFPIFRWSSCELMGSGEYVVETPGGPPIGHFGLAVRDYTHSTAPNRRFPDLITSRLLKAALAGQPPPYSNTELADLALHCTRQEDAAQKVERRMRKSEAALLLEARVGQRFDAIVTGSTADGIWVRIFTPPAEGKLVRGQTSLKVGDKVRVKLVATDVERGFIDFVTSD